MLTKCTICSAITIITMTAGLRVPILMTARRHSLNDTVNLSKIPTEVQRLALVEHNAWTKLQIVLVEADFKPHQLLIDLQVHSRS